MLNTCFGDLVQNFSSTLGDSIRSPSFVDPCDVSTPNQEAENSRRNIYLLMLNGDYWYKSVGCVVAVNENCDQMYNSEMLESCKVRMPCMSW